MMNSIKAILFDFPPDDNWKQEVFPFTEFIIIDLPYSTLSMSSQIASLFADKNWDQLKPEFEVFSRNWKCQSLWNAIFWKTKISKLIQKSAIKSIRLTLEWSSLDQSEILTNPIFYLNKHFGYFMFHFSKFYVVSDELISNMGAIPTDYFTIKFIDWGDKLTDSTKFFGDFISILKARNWASFGLDIDYDWNDLMLKFKKTIVKIMSSEDNYVYIKWESFSPFINFSEDNAYIWFWLNNTSADNSNMTLFVFKSANSCS